MLAKLADCPGSKAVLSIIEPPEKSDRHSGPAEVDDEKPLTLSTIHSAKGLEWEAVFLLRAGRGVAEQSLNPGRGGRGGGAPAVLRRSHPAEDPLDPDPV